MPTPQAYVTLVDGSGNILYPAPFDGWTLSSDTWTYASSTTFTIAGVDRTAVYTKGTRIKCTNSTLKYFVVVGSSFSTDTTVTVSGGVDYTLANAAITGGSYSYSLSPQGYPIYFNFAPGYTGFSANPTHVARFAIIGNICMINIYTTNNGTSNATTFTMTGLPVAVLASQGFDIGPFGGADNGGNISTVGITLATTVMTLNKVLGTAGGWTASAAKNLYSAQFQYAF